VSASLITRKPVLPLFLFSAKAMRRAYAHVVMKMYICTQDVSLFSIRDQKPGISMTAAEFPMPD